MQHSAHLLDIQHLKTHFATFEGVARAVDDVSFHLDRGEVLGVVGESGCGKSVTAQSIMRLIPEPPGKIVGGHIWFDGMDLTTLDPAAMRRIRGDRIAMIFQEPMTSLNPVYTIGDQIAEMFELHRGMKRREAWQQAVAMLEKVQIPAPHKRAGEYPHQLSGGMRQRAMIAMALACDPEILIADEPTTALDVTVQAQILDLMLQLKEDFQTAVMMITHDLGVIAEVAQRVVVMYAGKVVEQAPTLALFEDPKHPYTRGLLRSIPKLGERSRQGRRHLEEIPGMVPGLLELPPGCRFEPRCSHATAVCREREPELLDLGSNRLVRCHLYGS
ncbi:oligopeptide transport system ATP-binding protein [Desulfacinum hydrothermale DSM 13146]|uniref:Oligopeptide transport system ATP-binding protein n=1 Tax=Desulfacinum hydrothermale DSM 13146 TaxID=1121390 RepID=A0A1W1WYJ6_9BACT|nr:ABC transporter ATP-binding protein [Desulfacinum hydrothermale]SMC16724.1 oligopeptide transport system ATP-binding protein [Desulfacinum hydrothermale DSM 13146]